MEDKMGGFVLICNKMGQIKQILVNQISEFMDFRQEHDLASYVLDVHKTPLHEFLIELTEKSPLLGIHVTPSNSKSNGSIFLNGCQISEGLLMVGTLMPHLIDPFFFEQLMRINNHQMNLLRATIKNNQLEIQQTRTLNDTWKNERESILNRMSTINNELVDTQRELAKKNAILQRMLGDLERNIQIQKLESIGRLAGGLAHELNNDLTSILGNISLAQLDCDEESEAYLFLEAAIKGCQKAGDIANKFLTLSKGGSLIKEYYQIEQVVAEIIPVFTVSANLTIKSVIPIDLPPIYIDEGQIRQVFLNILLNAKDAIKGSGKITIDVSRVNDSDREALKISISDTGQGISPETMVHLFEPFFSTKKFGLGLGLAISRAIIEKHKGTINISSKINEGTCVTFMLPYL